MKRSIDKALTIPDPYFTSRIDAATARKLNIDTRRHPQPCPLAALILRGARSAEQWRVNALISNGSDGYHHVGSMWCPPGIDRGQVLKEAGAWVRESHPLAAPWDAIAELDLHDHRPDPHAKPLVQFAVDGLILVGMPHRR